MNKTPSSKTPCLLAALVLIFATNGHSQSTCIPVALSAIGDTARIETNRDSLVVRTDMTEAEQSIEAACVDVAAEGFYRIRAGVEYSGGKSNESFFLQVIHADSGIGSLCDANADNVKVVKVVEDIPDVETDIIRDAGVFFFQQGLNTITLNHYALIAAEYPQFIDPKIGSFDGPESVHIYLLQLEYFSNSDYDLQLNQSVTADSISIGDSISYQLKITNNGPGVAYNISLIDEIPTFLKLDSTSYKIAPDSIAVGDSSQLLHWTFDSLSTGNAIDISFSAESLKPDFPSKTHENILSKSRLVSVCDTDQDNNLDSSSVILRPPNILADVSILQTTVTDSFAVISGDTTWYVRAGEIFSYVFTVKNERDVEAQNVVVVNAVPDSVSANSTSGPDALKFALGSLPPFADTTFAIDVRLAPIMPEGTNILSNSVCVTVENEDPNALLNNAFIDTVYNIVPKQRIDLSIQQFVRTDSFTVVSADTQWFAQPGETYQYTILVHNEGNVEARNVVVVDIPPDSASAAAAIGADTLKMFIGTLAPNTDTTRVVNLSVAATMPVGQNLLVNTVLVSADEEPPSALLNNVAMDTVYNIISAGFANLALTQFVTTDSFTVAGADTQWFARAGEAFNYLMRVINSGSAAGENVLLLNDLPDYVSADGVEQSGTVQIEPGDLQPLADTTLVLPVRLSLNLPTGLNILVNHASVTATNEPENHRFDNSASQTVFNFNQPAPVEVTDLAIFQTARTDSFSTTGNDTLWFARAGDSFSYFLTVVNQENVQAKNVLVQDIVPDSVAVNGLAGGDTLEWFLGDLPPLARHNMSFQATVSKQIPHGANVSLVNRAFVTADNEDPSKLANNFSILGESVFAFSQPTPQENCDRLTLDLNIYKPNTDQPLAINFTLGAPKNARIDVYDMTGYHILELANRPFSAGANRLDWDGRIANGSEAGSGVYIIFLRSGLMNCWKKVILIR